MKTGFTDDYLAGFNSDERLKFDFTVLRKMIPDEVMFEEIKQQFVEVSRRDLLLIKEFVKTENRAELLMLAHKLSGRFAQMGSNYFGKELGILEKYLKEALSEEILNRFRKLVPEMEMAINAIS